MVPLVHGHVDNTILAKSSHKQLSNQPVKMLDTRTHALLGTTLLAAFWYLEFFWDRINAAI